MEKYRCINGSVLKWIGIFTMFIDHVGLVLVWKIFLLTLDPTWSDLYHIFRDIGRIAFPIFCFLLVEGFEHTRDRKKYLGRMCLFALISEIPFDLAIRGKWFTFEKSSVMLTFVLGLLLLSILHWLLEPIKGKGVNPIAFLRALLALAAIGITMKLAGLLHVDYGAVGILSILLFYLYRNNRFWAALLGCGALLLSFSSTKELQIKYVELPALLAILPIMFYDGTRGRQNKYFFYVFYPVHLLLLGLLAVYVLV